MLKKLLIQFFLIALIFIISILFYLKYINKGNQTNKDNKTKKEIIELEITKGNVLSNISYESQDIEGRQYIIKSQKGIVSKDNPNKIKMENVDAKIILIDGTSIKITSNYAVYNNIGYDTKFSSNVEVKHLDHKIKSDYLILSFKRNQLEAYNNLTYENLDLIMFADKIIFDFISRNTKIFNLDESNVKVQNK